MITDTSHIYYKLSFIRFYLCLASLQLYASTYLTIFYTRTALLHYCYHAKAQQKKKKKRRQNENTQTHKQRFSSMLYLICKQTSPTYKQRLPAFLSDISSIPYHLQLCLSMRDKPTLLHLPTFPLVIQRQLPHISEVSTNL